MLFPGRFSAWLALAPIACGASGGNECALAVIAANLAGDGATDCGVVALGADSSAVDACAVAAFQAGDAFTAIYELAGIDSQVSQATVSDGDAVYTLYRDSDPSGGSGVGARVQLFACDAPAVAAGDAGHDVVECGESSCGCDVTGCGDDGACCTP